MRERFYKILTFLAEMCGPWLFIWSARVIAAGYFVLFPGRTMGSMRFYRALFPGRNRFYYLSCAWRQFQSFTSVFLDRYLLNDPGAITFSFEGREHLYKALREGQGGILLMTHIGNWEVGARQLRRSIPNFRLMLFMGRRSGDQIEQLQKEDLAASGIRIIAADPNDPSPFDLLEAVGFIKSGGFVSMAGDVVWHRDQRTIAAGMLGHAVRLPEAPFMLALVSGAPLYIFFAASTGPRQYHFCVSPPVRVQAGARAHRRPAIAHAAQVYIDRIEEQLRRSPFEWYHFESFLGAAVQAGDSGLESVEKIA
ncbi:MAG: lauroyl acyltransferase [Desulfobacteraceae bacterium]|nr:MAG: lauroyl acyltransferase [Desulfobacteraceae bacterium]